MQKTLHSLQDMYALATEVASEISGGEILGLEGELGSGKTEFVRGLAIALGSKDKVRSPSFTLLNVYRTTHPTIKYLLHADLYRLQNSSSDVISEIGLDEWLGRDDVVIAIEWPKKDLLDQIKITQTFLFEYGCKENERVIKA